MNGVNASLPQRCRYLRMTAFAGVTTKELARQAGVSEALLYQHFPSKEHLYREVQDFYCKPSDELRKLVQSLVPGSASLVQILFFLAKVVVEKIPIGTKSADIVPRLMMFSLLDDGAFARVLSKRRDQRSSGADGPVLCPVPGQPVNCRRMICPTRRAFGFVTTY